MSHRYATSKSPGHLVMLRLCLHFKGVFPWEKGNIRNGVIKCQYFLNKQINASREQTNQSCQMVSCGLILVIETVWLIRSMKNDTIPKTRTPYFSLYAHTKITKIFAYILK